MERSPLLRNNAYGEAANQYGTRSTDSSTAAIYPDSSRRRQSSLVPGLTDLQYIQRQRYGQFYEGDEVPWQFQSSRFEAPTDKTSIQDSIQFHQEMLETFREQPWPMKQKIEAVNQAKEFLHWQVKQLDRTGNFTYRRKRNIKSVKKNAEDTVLSFKIWGGAVQNIEAYFGSGVASYFTFMRTLLWLNVLTGVLSFGFISVPQIVSGNITSLNFTVGLGALQDTILFYGAYDDGPSYYLLPLAYFLTTIVMFLISFIAVIRRMVTRYSKSKKMDTREDYLYSWQLLAGWDYTVASSAGVKDKISSLKTNFKEEVRELKEAKKSDSRNNGLIYAGRVVSNILVLALLVGSAILIVYVINVKDTIELPIGLEFAANLVNLYLLPVVVSALKLIVPMLFDLLVKMEKWHPRTEIKWTIARTTVFYYASLVVLIISLYDITTKCEQPLADITFPNITDCCWETVVGEEFFKLLILDVIIFILSVFILDLIRAAVVKTTRIGKRIGFSELNVTKSVLELIYGQALIWLGMYFSPLLPLVGVIKLFLLFYFRYVTVKCASVPPKRLFRASTSGSFYLGILLLTLFLCILPVGYAVFEIQPSPDCGPFQGLNRTYEVLTREVDKLPASWLWLEQTLNYITSPGIVAPFIIVLLLLILYYRVISLSYKDIIADLRMQLHYERRVGKRMVYAAAIGGGSSKIKEAPQIVIEDEG